MGSKEKLIPLVVELMDLTIDMLDAQATRKYMENKILNLLASKISEPSNKDYAALQARCERFKKALKRIELVGHGGTPFSIAECKRIANESLSGEGKEVENDDDDNYDVDQAFSFMND